MNQLALFSRYRLYRGSGAWSPFSLFANGGVQGAVYDPSYLNTYMSGLGSELVTNGDFSNGTTGWAVYPGLAPDTFEVVGGELHIANDGSTRGLSGTASAAGPSVVAGVTYKVTFTLRVVTASGNASVQLNANYFSISRLSLISNIASNYPVGTYEITRYYTATNTELLTFSIDSAVGAVSDLYFDNISVKEVTTIGNATMFTTSAGTTPVTAVEQNVGLILDQSQGPVLGSEQIATPLSVSGVGWSTVSNTIVATSTTATGTVSTTGTLATTKRYQVSFTASSLSGATCFVQMDSSVAALTKRIATAGNYTFILFGAGAANIQFQAYEGTAFSVTISNLSIKELPGNHAYVTADANRGILRSRFNQLTYSEQYDNAVWTKSNSFIQTNLLTYSEQFDNAVWTVAGGNLLAFGSGSVANATAAPDGTTTADLIVPNTTLALHSIWQTAVTTASGASYTASWYVKPNGYTKIAIVENQITGYETAYDATGAGSVLRQANATGTITALANGWYRITHTSVAGASFRPQLFVLPPSYTSGPVIAATWTPNGTDGIYIWGAQLVQGSVPGDYRATAASALPILYTDPLGGLTAMELGLLSGGGLSQFFQVPSITSASLTDSIWVRADTPVTLAFGFFDSTGDVININVTTSWQRFTHTRAAGLTSGDRRVCWLYKGTAGGTTVQIWGGQFVQTDVFPTNTYQRIAAATDYATGPAFPLYIQTDGVNDAMLTNTINFANGPTNPPIVGPELVTNGDFSSATGWTTDAYCTISGGVLTFNGANPSPSYCSQTTISTTIGKFYKVTFNYTVSSGGIRLNTTQFGATSYITSGSGTASYYLLATAASGTFSIQAGLVSTAATIDNISVKEMDSAYAPDKMTVTAGVTKLAASGMITELSATASGNTGSFQMFWATSNYQMISGGTTPNTILPAANVVPSTNVASLLASISTPSLIGRVNAVDVASSNLTQGTGNFGNYPLYLFARNNASFYFNGYFYGAVVVQKYLSAGELTSLTNWMEVRTFGKDMAYDYDYVTLANGDSVTLDNGDPVYTNIYYS